NRLSTADWLGSTMYRPTSPNTASTLATIAATSSVAPPPAVTTRKNAYAQPASTASSTSSTGMPGRDRIGFSFMRSAPVAMEINRYQTDINLSKIPAAAGAGIRAAGTLGAPAARAAARPPPAKGSNERTPRIRGLLPRPGAGGAGRGDQALPAGGRARRPARGLPGDRHRRRAGGDDTARAH